jgi:hypothetical protein
MTQASSPKDSATPPRVRLEGVLDMVQASDSSFRLSLADGRTVPGRLVGPPITSLARVLGRTLLVFGTGRFGPGGELEGVDADGFIPNDGQPWDVSPDDFPFSREVAEEMSRRFRSIVGAWPGDETDDQVEQALRELS